MGAVEGMEEEEEDEDSKEGILEGTKKPRLKVPSVASPKPQAVQVNNAMQTLLMNMGFIPSECTVIFTSLYEGIITFLFLKLKLDHHT